MINTSAQLLTPNSKYNPNLSLTPPSKMTATSLTIWIYAQRSKLYLVLLYLWNQSIISFLIRNLSYFVLWFILRSSQMETIHLSSNYWAFVIFFCCRLFCFFVSWFYYYFTRIFRIVFGDSSHYEVKDNLDIECT